MNHRCKSIVHTIGVLHLSHFMKNSHRRSETETLCLLVLALLGLRFSDYLQVVLSVSIVTMIMLMLVRGQRNASQQQ